MLAQPDAPGDARTALRLVTFGLPLQADEMAAFRRRFGVELFMGFGMTESCAGGTRTPSHVDGRRGPGLISRIGKINKGQLRSETRPAVADPAP